MNDVIVADGCGCLSRVGVIHRHAMMTVVRIDAADDVTVVYDRPTGVCVETRTGAAVVRVRPAGRDYFRTDYHRWGRRTVVFYVASLSFNDSLPAGEEVYECSR